MESERTKFIANVTSLLHKHFFTIKSAHWDGIGDIGDDYCIEAESASSRTIEICLRFLYYRCSRGPFDEIFIFAGDDTLLDVRWESKDNAEDMLGLIETTLKKF